MGPGPWTCCHNILRWELFGGTNLMHGGSRKADDLLGDCRRGATRHSLSIPEMQANNRQSFHNHGEGPKRIIIVGAFKQEKALVGSFSVIVKTLVMVRLQLYSIPTYCL